MTIPIGVREPAGAGMVRKGRRKDRSKIVRIDYRSGETREMDMRREVWKMLQTELEVIETIVGQLRQIGDAMEP